MLLNSTLFLPNCKVLFRHSYIFMTWSRHPSLRDRWGVLQSILSWCRGTDVMSQCRSCPDVPCHRYWVNCHSDPSWFVWVHLPTTPLLHLGPSLLFRVESHSSLRLGPRLKSHLSAMNPSEGLCPVPAIPLPLGQELRSFVIKKSKQSILPLVQSLSEQIHLTNNKACSKHV